MQSREEMRAFSLVEVLIALAVLAVALSALYGAFVAGLGMIKSARETTRATQIVLQKLESIRLYSWTQLTNAGFIPATFTEPFPATATNAPLFTYYGTIIIGDAPIAAAYADDLRQVTVRLDWTNSNRARHEQMTSLVARDGLQHYIP